MIVVAKTGMRPIQVIGSRFPGVRWAITGGNLAWRGGAHKTLFREATNRFEIGGELPGGKAAVRAIASENAIPAALKAMRGEGKVHGEALCMFVKCAGPAMRRLPGHGKLGPDKKAVGIRAVASEQTAMKFAELKFVPFGILAPRHEQPPSACIIRVGKKPQPVKITDAPRAICQRTEAFVKIRRVVERVPLDKHRDVRKRVIPRRKVMQVGVRLASGVRKRDATGNPGAFVINSGNNLARYAAQPSKIFGVVRNDEFHAGRHWEMIMRHPAFVASGSLRHGGGMDWISREQWASLHGEGTDVHRVATERGGWLDRYGGWVVWSGNGTPDMARLNSEMAARYGFVPRGCLVRGLVRTAPEQQAAHLLSGEAPGVLAVREAGLVYEVEPAGGYSTGFFPDQRINRRWIAGLGAKRMLNLFAYTCSFTVCAAAAGAETCSVDASKRALERGRRNLELNGIDSTSGHRFLADDARKVVARLSRRGEEFDAIVLDPPTFGRAGGAAFRIEGDLPDLVRGCWRLLARGGWLLVSTNYARWTPRILRDVCSEALRGEACRMTPGELPPEIPRGAVSWRIQKSKSRRV